MTTQVELQDAEAGIVQAARHSVPVSVRAQVRMEQQHGARRLRRGIPDSLERDAVFRANGNVRRRG